MNHKTITRILVTLGVTASIVTVTVVPVAAQDNNLGATLGALWESVLETPAPANPFTGGDPCVDLGGGVVAPFAPLGPSSPTCTIKPDTKVFITAESSECSTIEEPPFFGANQPQLRTCARAADTGFTIPTITLDGNPVPVREVETALLTIDMPDTNIFGIPAQTGFSAGHGWVALLNPLIPGTHHIIVHVVGTDVYGNAIKLTNPTTLIVTRDRQCTPAGTPQSCAIAILEASRRAANPTTPDTDADCTSPPVVGGFCLRYFRVGYHVVSVLIPCPRIPVIVRR